MVNCYFNFYIYDGFVLKFWYGCLLIDDDFYNVFRLVWCVKNNDINNN